MYEKRLGFSSLQIQRLFERHAESDFSDHNTSLEETFHNAEDFTSELLLIVYQSSHFAWSENIEDPWSGSSQVEVERLVCNGTSPRSRTSRLCDPQAKASNHSRVPRTLHVPSNSRQIISAALGDNPFIVIMGCSMSIIDSRRN